MHWPAEVVHCSSRGTGVTTDPDSPRFVVSWPEAAKLNQMNTHSGSGT